MIKGVIVEDQANHRDVLRRNLITYCPDVQIVVELVSGEEALRVLPSLAFDILFLDIELGDMNSFDMLQKLPGKDFHIIFITSYDSYAMKAFEVHAVDYLLKPVDGTKLIDAIKRAMSNIFSTERRIGLVSEYSMSKNNHLLITCTNEYKLVDFSEIFYCRSDINYTDIYYLDESGTLIKSTETHNLKYFEEKLKPFGFLRIHQSYLVNKEHVTRIRKNPCEIVLSNNMSLPVSRDRKQDVIDFFNS
ncbi:MAG: response regulator transcription factor [Bacteroidetes bacterium]|nr:response regulator transcription factor [Bacteroidota bacterium]